MPDRAGVVIGAMLGGVLVVGSAGCSSTTAALQSGLPQGIVIDRGSSLQIWPSVSDGSPRDVTSASGAGFPRLTAIEQLDAQTVVALDDGKLVTLNPSKPDKIDTIAAASDWFRAADKTSAWIVTLFTDRSCPTIASTQTGTDRYEVARIKLPGGAVLVPARKLPCHMRPRAAVNEGLLVDELSNTTEGSGKGYAVPADIQLIDDRTFRIKRTVEHDATVVQAANDTVIASRGDCDSGDCTVALSVSGEHVPRVGAIPQGGLLGAAALIDHTGRFLVAGTFTPNGDTELAFFDLETGSSRDLGPYSSVTPHALDALTDDMPAVWSGDRLLIVDPQRLKLMTYATSTGQILSRDIGASSDDVQVWGAAR